jgi:DNA mismatch endonuclease, patch repair protein
LADIFSQAKRSQVMAKVPLKDSKPEVLLRKFLFSKGLRFRKNVKNLPGSPDIVLPKYKVAIFVHGCFWHAHTKCKYAKIPLSNSDFWTEKLLANVTRDKLKERLLRKLGWKVITVWQCKLRSQNKQRTFNAILKHLSVT